jgi:hypothetical protein
MFCELAEQISERIIHPLLAALDPYLRRDAQALLNATYDLEAELTNILIQPLSDDFSTALHTMASSRKADAVWDVLTRLFTRDQSQILLVGCRRENVSSAERGRAYSLDGIVPLPSQNRAIRHGNELSATGH